MEIKYVELLRSPLDNSVYAAVIHYMDGTKQTSTTIKNG